MEDCQSEANKLKEANNMIDALQYMILSPHPEHALEVGISLIKGIVFRYCLSRYFLCIALLCFVFPSLNFAFN